MEKSNLIKILKSFNSKEFKDFGEYIYSPFFNKNESIRQLFDYLKKQYPEFEINKISKEKVYTKIFPGAEYNDDFMRMLLFNTAKLAEDYLAYLRMTNSKWEMREMLLEELDERKLDKIFNKILSKTTHELEKIERKDVKWYYHKYTLDSIYISQVQRIHLTSFDKFLKEAPLEEMHNDFTAYYIINMLKMHNFLLNTQKLYKHEEDLASFEKIITSLDEKFLKKTPLIEIYYNLIMLLITDDEKYFNSVKGKLDSYEKVISSSDMMELLINLQNFCARKIRKGEVKFVRELFELYKIEIERDVYHYLGNLHDRLYKSTIEMGLELGEVEWVKKFIEKYKDELQPASRVDSYMFGKAYFDFKMGNFEKALETLSRIKLYGISSKIEVKELTSKIYYEMKMEDMLFSLTDTFRHLLANNKMLTESRKKGYANYIKYLKKLYKIKINPNPGDLAETTQMMKNEDLLANRIWLSTKARELEKKSLKYI